MGPCERSSRPFTGVPDAEDEDARNSARIRPGLVEPGEWTALVPATARAVRGETRFLAIEDRLWIEWRVGEDCFGRSGRLINVSLHGALIVASALFQEKQTVRIFLEEPAPQVGVSATVIGVIEGTRGANQFRLQFHKACPDSFIDAAVMGFESWMKKGRSAI